MPFELACLVTEKWSCLSLESVGLVSFCMLVSPGELNLKSWELNILTSQGSLWGESIEFSPRRLQCYYLCGKLSIRRSSGGGGGGGDEYRHLWKLSRTRTYFTRSHKYYHRHGHCLTWSNISTLRAAAAAADDDGQGIVGGAERLRRDWTR